MMSLTILFSITDFGCLKSCPLIIFLVKNNYLFTEIDMENVLKNKKYRLLTEMSSKLS